MSIKHTIPKALDRPRKLFSSWPPSMLAARQENLQTKLMQMRDRGQVRFDIKKGTWSQV